MTDNNVVSINGRLVRDAELRFSTSGAAVLRFSIAVNRSVKKGDKWEDEASFFDCTMFGKMAESVSKYLNKGKQVLTDYKNLVVLERMLSLQGVEHSEVQ